MYIAYSMVDSNDQKHIVDVDIKFSYHLFLLRKHIKATAESCLHYSVCAPEEVLQ